MFEITIRGNTPEELYDFMQEVLHKRSPITIPGKMPENPSTAAAAATPAQPAPATAPQQMPQAAAPAATAPAPQYTAPAPNVPNAGFDTGANVPTNPAQQPPAAYQQPAQPQYQQPPMAQPPQPAAPVQQAPVQQAPPMQQPPNAAPTYTIEQLAAAGASLAQIPGKMEPVLAMLARYGVQSVNQLRSDQYGAIATELRALGAQI